MAVREPNGVEILTDGSGPVDEALARSRPPRRDRSDLSSLSSALGTLREALGFETARAFARGPEGWVLLDQDGREQLWHAILDPAALEGLPEAAEFDDVRAVPGVGPRLARLGCASLAILPLPEGGRLLLDSAEPVSPRGWIERSRPYLALVSVLTGPAWPGAGAIRGHDEMTALQRLFTVCQEAIGQQGLGAEEFLLAARSAIRADEAYVLHEEAGTWVAERIQAGSEVRHLDTNLSLADASGDSGEVEETVLQRLAFELGVTSPAVAAAFGREDRRPEVLVAGWSSGPALSPVAMAIAARAVSTTREALRTMDRSVDSRLDRERTRLASALHDGLTQTVTGAVLELEALHKAIERDPAEALETLEHSKIEIRRSLAELRVMLSALSRGDERPRSDPESLTRYVEDVVRRWRLPARVTVEGDLSQLPDRVLSVAYVVIREALANAAKHAAARNVSVSLTAGDGDLVIVVGDKGPGFTRSDEDAAREANHVGLDLLRRQVHDISGSLRIDSHPGKGTRLIARLPIHGVAS